MRLHSVGSDCASIVSVREIFRSALRANAAHVILLHNHPSGDPTPSKADVAITRRIRLAGELIGIELLDHIIIGNNSYISFSGRESDIHERIRAKMARNVYGL